MGESDFFAGVGANIKTYRRLQHMTQKELADRICKSVACVSKYERGEVCIDLYTVYEIAGALNVPVSLLLPQDAGILPALPVSAELPSLFQLSPLYLYTLNTQKNEVVSSVIEIDPKSMEATAYYATTDLQNYRSSAYIMLGSIQSSESNVRLYFSNPLLKGDFMMICFRTADLIAGQSRGVFFALNSMYRFCTSKCYLSVNPIRELNALKGRLSAEKEEISAFRKKNVLSL